MNDFNAGQQRKNALLIFCQLVAEYEYFDMFMICRACSSGKRQAAGNGIHSQDQLLSQSTDDQEEYTMVDFQSVFHSPYKINFTVLTCDVTPSLFLLFKSNRPTTHIPNTKIQSKVHIARRHRRHLPFFRTCVPILFVFSVILVCTVMIWQYYALYEQLSDNRSKIEQGDISFTERMHRE